MRKLKGDDRLEITLHEVLSDVTHAMDFDADQPEKDGVEADLQVALADAPHVLRRGLPARAPRVADGHRAGRPDVPRRRGRLDRGGDQARSARSTPSSSSPATSSGSGSIPAMADCRGVLAAPDRQAAGARAGRGARARLGRGRPRGAARRARAGADAVRLSAVTAARERAATIAANGPLAVAATKRILTADEAGAWERQAEIAEPVFASEDAREGARAFAEKRPPVWRSR